MRGKGLIVRGIGRCLGNGRGVLIVNGLHRSWNPL
jgi:hypothetical protein